MKRFFKRMLCVLLCFAAAFGLYHFGPNLYVRFFGERSSRWISERFSETLHEKNELIVYEVEIAGKETVSQDAWLIGTVQKVEMPYVFQMRFTVDLSRADVSANGNVIEVRVPAPQPGYAKLTVDEANVKKNDWLYRLTPERYAQIQKETEEKLFAQGSENEQYRQCAWNTTVHNLEEFFNFVASQSLVGRAYEVRVIEQGV